MQELIVFVHGMVNFSHNRTAGIFREKEAQERLIYKQIGSRHNFLGAFDDSGNYAFRTMYPPVELKAEVLGTLSKEYRVKGAVVVERASAEEALASLDALCDQIYQEQFRARDNLVLKELMPWRLGVVFVQELYDVKVSFVKELADLEDEHLEILSVQHGIVGVLKLDPKKPRIPWGEPALTVEGVLAKSGANWLATGRSARTVRGVLRKFSQ